MHTGYELLWMAAERTPMHPALIDDRTDRRLTYAELIAEVDAVAAGFAARGIGRGVRVAIALPGVWEHCIAILALMRLNAVYKHVNGSGPCTLCGPGRYSAEPGQVTCIACPSNSSSGPGSGNVTDCECNAGYSGPDGGACVACGAGTHKDVNGTAPCTLCPGGKYSATTAAMSEAT